MSVLEKLGSVEYALIDAIRRSGSSDRTILAAYSGLSWPTVKKSYTKLKELGILIDANETSLTLNSSLGCILGISVGTREIKAVFCDFTFTPLSRKYLRSMGMGNILDHFQRYDKLDDNNHHICMQSSQDQDEIADIVTEIIEGYLSLASKGISLIGIGLAFPGVVNPDTNQIISCPNIPSLNGKDIIGLLKRGVAKIIEDEKIPLVVEHNAKTCFINEKELLYDISRSSKNTDPIAFEKDVLCIYAGTGIGLGGCSNGVLMTGIGNSFGELGHILSPIYGNEVLSENECCPFCHRQCLEWLIRKNVFHSSTIEEFRNATERGLLETFSKDHPDEYKVLTKYVGFLLNTVINIFNPEVLILSGRIFDCIAELRNDIESLKSTYTLPYVGRQCRLIVGNGQAYGVARGAAINMYMRRYSHRGSVISWPV